MRTAARLADAAKEGAALLSKGGKAVDEILGSEAHLPLSAAAALDLSGMRGKYGSVASRLKLNEPDLLACYKHMLASRRTYLKLGERQREADRVAKQCGGNSTVSSVR